MISPHSIGNEGCCWQKYYVSQWSGYFHFKDAYIIAFKIAGNHECTHIKEAEIKTQPWETKAYTSW